MKKVVSTLAAFAMMGFVSLAGSATAGAGSSCSAEKTAKTASSCSVKAEKVAMSDCASKSGATEDVNLVKGGGAEDAATKTASSCSLKAEKVAMSDCASKCSAKEDVNLVKGGGSDDMATKAASSCSVKAEKVAMSDCAAKCSAKEDVNLVKGGGSDDMATKTGYGLGHTVPNFTLTDTKGKQHSLADYGDQVKVLVFYNQNCPYVVEVQDRLAEFTTKYSEKGVALIAIDPSYTNSLEEIASHGESKPYPILVNNSSDMARKFEATRTPEVFVLDKNNTVVYTGMFDSGKVAEGETRKTPTKDAVKALLNGGEVTVQKTKAFGCTVKFNPKTAEAGTDASNAGG